MDYINLDFYDVGFMYYCSLSKRKPIRLMLFASDVMASGLVFRHDFSALANCHFLSLQSQKEGKSYQSYTN